MGRALASPPHPLTMGGGRRRPSSPMAAAGGRSSSSPMAPAAGAILARAAITLLSIGIVGFVGSSSYGGRHIPRIRVTV